MNIVFMSLDTLPSTLWARDLYDQMHIRSDFRKWFPRMCQYGFIEGRDYEYMPRVRLQDEGGRTVQRYVKDYRITQDMAKKLCKLHHTAVGAAYHPQPFDWDALLGLLHKKPPRRSSYEAQLSESNSLVTTTQIAKEYTDFSELTTPMLNEFIEKVVVHEATGGRGNSRRQRLDIYLNFIGAFEVPAHIVTPMEEEAERRRQEEQAAKEARSRELKKVRYEKQKQEKRDFTARKKAGLLTPEEQADEEKRSAKKREQNQAWREKQRASQPPKPPKPHSLTELARMKREGLPLTPEEAQRLAEYRQRKNEQIRQSQQRRLAREAAEKAEKGKKIA